MRERSPRCESRSRPSRPERRLLPSRPPAAASRLGARRGSGGARRPRLLDTGAARLGRDIYLTFLLRDYFEAHRVSGRRYTREPHTALCGGGIERAHHFARRFTIFQGKRYHLPNGELLQERLVSGEIFGRRGYLCLRKLWHCNSLCLKSRLRTPIRGRETISPLAYASGPR